MTKLLLANGANVNIVDYVGMSPAMCAARLCHINLLKLYLKNGLNINQKDDNGWTALHFAASYGAKRVVQLLVYHGADLNAINFPSLSDSAGVKDNSKGMPRNR